MTNPLIIAHRGGAGLWPENTIQAFTEAAKAGFDGAELDVHLTRDGKLAVFHDFRVKRGLWRRAGFGPGPRALAGLDYAMLAGLEIPLLADVVRAVRAIRADFLLLVEIKSAAAAGLSAPPETMAQAIVADMNAHRAWDNVVLVGFDWRALLGARRLQPAARCWFSTMRTPPRRSDAWAGGFHPRRFGGSIAEAIMQAGGEGWFAQNRQATETSVREARARGLRVGTWTVNAPRHLRAAIARGLDAICTDRPDLLAEILRSQSPSNNAVER